jgi:hypothetical protein
MPNPPHLSKSDFLLFCEAPRHLWALKHGLFTAQLTEFERHLIEQGYQVEQLAHQRLHELYGAAPDRQLIWQLQVADGPFQARLDALLFKPASGRYDLVEIKSGTGVDQQDLLDVAFQAAILESPDGRRAPLEIENYFIMHPDKRYVRRGEIRLDEFFIIEEIDDKLAKTLPQARALRQQALQVLQQAQADFFTPCSSPKNCPCPDVCHPGLPEFSIYDIPRLSPQKKAELRGRGILQASDTPDDFPLSDKQRQVVRLAQSQALHVDRPNLRRALAGLEQPLYFLDFETCNTAVPPFDGYHPHQHVVFQYSLHRLDGADGELSHRAFLASDALDPSAALLERLSGDLGEHGAILVWNQSFEKSRLKELAALQPRYAAWVARVLERVCDLGEIVNQGYVLHPAFKGSWSIKYVLPALAPDLSYDSLAIQRGEQASIAWLRLCFGQVPPAEHQALIDGLLEYCHLDTLAMVRIYQVFAELARG